LSRIRLVKGKHLSFGRSLNTLLSTYLISAIL